MNRHPVLSFIMSMAVVSVLTIGVMVAVAGLVVSEVTVASAHMSLDGGKTWAEVAPFVPMMGGTGEWRKGCLLVRPWEVDDE